MRSRSTCGLLPAAFGAFLCSAGLCGQSWQLTPVEVGSGELMLLDSPTVVGKDTVAHWYVVELGGKGVARECLRADGNITVHCRLDLCRLLVSDHGAGDGMFVVDLRKGAALPIGAGTHEFVAVRGGDVLFLGDGRREDERLYAQPWTKAAPARALAEPRFAQVIVSGDVALGYGPESASRLHRVDLVAGGSTDLGWLPMSLHHADVRLALSPDGRRFAVGMPDGTLRVHTLADGKLERRWSEVPIGLPADSSSHPVLEVAFDGPDTVVCSESRGQRYGPRAFAFVSRSIRTGEVVGETEYEVGLRHSNPRPSPLRVAHLTGEWPRAEERVPRGRFEIADTRLFYADGDEPVAVWEEAEGGGGTGSIGLTPDGAFAIVLRDDGAAVVDVIDGAARARRRVLTGPATDLLWLPAAR